MPYGRGQANADHGFTRRLGTDLRNDHPISFTYDAALASADGELRTPPSSLGGRPLIANRVAGMLETLREAFDGARQGAIESERRGPAS